MNSSRLFAGIGLGLAGFTLWVGAAYSAATHAEHSSLGVIFGAALTVWGIAVGFAAFDPGRSSRGLD